MSAMFVKRLKNIPVIYRAALFLRRCLVPALVDALLEFYRSLAALSWSYLYSVEEQRKTSRAASFLCDIRKGPPFRLFSVYQALRCGCPKFQGRIVLEDQGYPVVRQGSLLAEGTTKAHTEQPWPIFWSRHPDASLVSRSLALMLPGKELCLEAVYGFRAYRDDDAARYWKLPPPVALDGPWTSIVSRWTPNQCVTNHSHWLFDALPRLALLREFPADTRVIVPSKLAAYQKESLSMLGLTADRLRFSPETHLQVQDYFFSSPTAMVACHSPYGVRFLRDSFLAKADPAFQPPKRFFLRRSGLSRNMDNEAEVERFFVDRGWALINPSELTFAQEIRLFAEAEAISGMQGSALSNLVFSNPRCAVLAMAHDYWTDGVLDWILQSVGINKFSWHIYASNGCRRFSVDLKVLQKQFDSLGLS
jgi:hypothetical protein